MGSATSCCSEKAGYVAIVDGKYGLGPELQQVIVKDKVTYKVKSVIVYTGRYIWTWLNSECHE
jgi:hypothetical protein